VASRKNSKPQQPEEISVEPSVRVFTRWTPQLILAAEIAADAGNLTQAAKVVAWLLTDDRIRGCLNARIQSLLGMVPSFESSGDRRRSKRAIKALEAGDDFWVSYPEEELWLMLAWGLLLGVCPMRHNPRYPEGHEGRLLPFPEFWHPAAGLRFDQEERVWKIRVASPGNSFGVEETLTPGDGTWLLHTPFGKHRPWELGFWKCLAWWKLLKDYGRSDWARNMEKGALLVVTQGLNIQNGPPQLADTKPIRDQAAQDLYQRGKDAVAVLPVGKDLKLIETSGKSADLYDGGIDKANEAFAVCIRGGNLTSMVDGGGGRSAAEVQERTGDFVNLRFDAETTANTLHRQSLPYWAQWNYGDKSLAPWPNYPVAPQRNLGAHAETISKFNAAVQEAEFNGFEVDRDAALEEFELLEFMKAGTKPAISPLATPVAPANDNGPAPKSAGKDPSPDPATAEQ
jgi:hypothetical protein